MAIELHFSPAEPKDGDGGTGPWLFHGHAVDPQTLPYYVELWSKEGDAVERVIALSTNSAIAHASYYAAIGSYPDRVIVLRLDDRVVARSQPARRDPSESASAGNT